jgi:hypothetical protein
MIEVSLTWAELLQAALVGITRHIASIKKDLQDKHGLKRENAWTVHIEGAAGEMAFAKAMNKYYSSSVNTFKSSDGDVDKLEIRTRADHGYDLIVRKDDKPNRRYVLVTGMAPHFRIIGWLEGSLARRDKWWKTYANRPGAWFVPKNSLKPINTIYN